MYGNPIQASTWGKSSKTIKTTKLFSGFDILLYV